MVIEKDKITRRADDQIISITTSANKNLEFLTFIAIQNKRVSDGAI